MSTLFQIISSLQMAKGSLAKQAILDANASNSFLKAYLRATYDPAISYYQKKAPVTGMLGKTEFEPEDIDAIINTIAKRWATGKKAVTWLQMFMQCMDEEGQELTRLLIDRSIGAGVGDTMVLKTFPGLYFIPPYQRCSLMDDKAKLRFAKLRQFYVQTKCDGSFAYVANRLNGTVDVITRQGSTYPQDFASNLATGVPVGWVMVGELEVYKDGVLLDRKTGNGMLNSSLKDGELPEGHEVRMTAWDMLTEEEFSAGKSLRKYSERLERLENWLRIEEPDNIKVVYYEVVTSLAKAMAIYIDHTSRGLEGCVAKDPASLWKDGTAKDIIKLKLKFEAEYRCTGMYEGEGTMCGVMGGISIATEDGLLENNCGSGFTVEQRKLFWDQPHMILQQVVMLSANDIIQSRDARKKPSLSLPIFEEVRYDKKTTGANTLPEVLAILQATKEGK